MENFSRSRRGERKMNFPNVLFYMRNLTFLPSSLSDFFPLLAGWLACVVVLMTIEFLVSSWKLKKIVVMIVNRDY